ncbi:hypothetical protein Tco_0994598 [Tanacetum coccineum]
MRMEQYLTHTDYALWEVIVNGDAPAVASASSEGPIPPKTAKQNLARKNELKAKSTLLLAIPVEYLLKFHEIKDAKTLWEAIKTSTNEAVNTAHDVPAARSRDKLLPQPMLMIDGSQMAGSHAYHEGEEILKEDRKESEFQWQRNYWL